MSKYSRTRKAICRISRLSEWTVTRSEFRNMSDTTTWKQAFRIARKHSRLYHQTECKHFRKRGFSIKPFKPIELRYNYKEAREKFSIWKLIYYV